MTMLLQIQREQMMRSSSTPAGSTPPRDYLRLSLSVPVFSGYADGKSVAMFVSELRDYQAASGIDDETILTRLLPVALTDSAALWRQRQTKFTSMSDFEARFRTEFLPPDYSMRIRDELRARTQHPEESLIEFVRALQGLYDIADAAAPDAEKVQRAIRQSHPRFHPHLRGRTFNNLDEMAREAITIQADILAELRYRPPPPQNMTLEPSFAWSGNARVHSVEREPDDSNQASVPRALDPRAYESRRCSGYEGIHSQRYSPSIDQDEFLASGPVTRSLGEARKSGTPHEADGRATPRCFRCGQPGHIHRDCSERQRPPQTQGNGYGRRW
uniref:Putative retrotransposon gag protein n=1 Tax=Ixodes ricinus TaxID=34613 RepID=A0A147BJB3_IXORI